MSSSSTTVQVGMGEGKLIATTGGHLLIQFLRCQTRRQPFCIRYFRGRHSTTIDATFTTTVAQSPMTAYLLRRFQYKDKLTIRGLSVAQGHAKKWPEYDAILPNGTGAMTRNINYLERLSPGWAHHQLKELALCEKLTE